MKRFRYLGIYAFVPLAMWSFIEGGALVFAIPFIMFGMLPAIELFWHGSEDNHEASEEDQLKAARAFDVALYLAIPAQYALLAVLLYQVAWGAPRQAWEWAGALWTMGIFSGAFGINVAHELGHRRKAYEQNFAKTLLLSSLYMHFFIEHNRGHHARVATEDDPASSRYGENLYAFWLRSVYNSYRSAWKLEHRRLTRRGHSWFSLRNQMLRFQLIQLAFVVLIGAVFGWIALAAFLVTATFGFLLLETVNYIEHYGLQRKRLDNGRFEKVLPIHSWNSNHPLGRLFLFELSRHSDHHASATRKYQVLRHFDESPQMPTGYPGMMVLALFPPLWFFVMHRHIRAHQERQHTQTELQLQAQH